MNAFNFPSSFNIPMYQTPKVQTVIADYLSGESAFHALQKAVDELCVSAPKDHDVIIEAFHISVTKVQYMKPHMLVLTGFNSEGHATSVVLHYSQLIARIIYQPKRGPERVITGFSK